MFLSAYFLLANISEPCWRLLLRLKIIASKEVVEKWVRKHIKSISSSKNSVLVYVFDNCSFSLHVTHVRSDHRSSYIHVLNRFIVEIPQACKVLSRNLWKEVTSEKFGKWIHPTPMEAENFAEYCWKVFSLRPPAMPLRFLYTGHPSRVRKSDITILEPLPNLQTLTYQDIEIAVSEFFERYILPSNRTFAFVSGDQQVWIKLWLLRKRQPLKYHWMIPVPGEWHWEWHILKGIYVVFYDTILFPFSKLLGYSSLDKEVKNFHYAEDFLEVVTIAIFQWIQASMQNWPDDWNVIDWLHDMKAKGNRVAYELGYACYWYFIPYWVTR